MTFPNPKNVSDWQTAYTRDDAFKEYGKHNQLSDLVMLLGGLSISIFIAILASPRINLTSLSIYLKLVLFLVLVVLVFIVLILVKSRATCFAKIFFGDFYQPPEEIDPTKIIDYRLHGRLKLPPPFNLLSQFKYIMAKEGEIAVRSEKWPAWSARNLGGPILLIVFDGCALYLEHGNRFSRIVGPGDKAPNLEWYETIKYEVDLRPKIKSGN